MKLIIAGGRNYNLTYRDYVFLDSLRSEVTEVVSGRCTGVDCCGEEWAEFHGIHVEPFPVTSLDWKRLGHSAGPRRNRLMAEYADAVVLFPGGKGTASMKAEALRAGIKIYEPHLDSAASPLEKMEATEENSVGSSTKPPD